MIKVLWLTYVASPYKKCLFEELNKKVDLTVLLCDRKEDNRNNSWNFNNVSFKVVYIDKEYKQRVNELVLENDILIDSMYYTKYGIYTTKVFRKHKKVILLQADGGIAIDRGFIVNKLISYFMNRHDYFISSGESTDINYFDFYNIERSKINHYRFTSLTEKDIKRHKEMMNSKAIFRKELGVEGFTFLSVGRPLYSKGFDILAKVARKTKGVNYLVIGGKPLKDVNDYITENKVNNIRFLDTIESSELEKYYAACDAFIFPTRSDVWGLVVNEAMSFGLPIITSNKCIAGLHFKDVCKIVEYEDVDGYIKEVNEVSDDKREKELEIISEYTIENSAKDLLGIINSIKK